MIRNEHKCHKHLATPAAAKVSMRNYPAYVSVSTPIGGGFDWMRQTKGLP